MKKIWNVVICLALAALLLTSVFAAGSLSASLSASKTTANRGNEITFTVSVPEFADCKSGSVVLSYDTGVFEFVSGKILLTGTFMSDLNSSDGVFAYTEPQTVSGNIAQFTLKVKDGAAYGASSVSVDVTLNSSADSASGSKFASVTVACKHQYDNDCDTTCGDCGAERTVTHSWDSGKVTTGATCTSTGVKTYTCKVCGETKTETVAKKAHKYENDCDADCNTCGEKRTVTHSYKTAWSSDGTGHWHACSVCGHVKDKAAHTPGAEATEWKAQTCTVCGYTIKAALGHTHTYENEWSSDESGHWYACGGCDEHGSEGAHVYDNDCDADCNTCGYTREVSHSYGEDWISDETNHWHECAVCGITGEVVEHTFEDGVCTECGWDEGPEPSTGPSTEPSEDATDGCSHTWGEGVVTRPATEAVPGLITYTCGICGEVRTETVPSLSANMDVDYQFPWWLVGVVAGILLLGLALYIILGLIGAKRQKGKYTG